MVGHDWVSLFCESDAWERDRGTQITSLPFLGFTPCFEDVILLGCVHICLLVLCARRFYYIRRGPKANLVTSWPQHVKLCFAVPLVFVPVFQMGGRFAQVEGLVVRPVAQNEVFCFVLEFAAWACVVAVLTKELFTYAADGVWLFRFGFLFAFLTNSIKLWLLFRSWETQYEGAHFFYGLFLMSYGCLFFLSLVAALHHPALDFQNPYGNLTVPLLQAELAGDTISEKCQDKEIGGHVDKHPEDAAGLLSRFFFGWLNPMMKLGFSRPLAEEDIWELGESDVAALQRAKLEQALRDGRKPGTPDNVKLAIFRAWWRPLVVSACWKLLNDAQQFSGPLLMGMLLNALHRISQEDDASSELVWTAYGYGVAMFAAQVAGAVGEAQYFQGTMRVGFQVRSALMSLIYSKSLRLSRTSLSKFGVGRLNNMMASDAEAIQMLINQIQTAWSAPLRIVVALVLLASQVGLAALAGLTVILLAMPLQKRLMAAMSVRVRAASSATDERVRLIDETFGAIQIVKLYAWEPSFEQFTRIARNLEIDKILSYAKVRAVSGFLVQGLPVVVSMGTFVTWALVYQTELTPSVAFTTLALLSVLQGPFFTLPNVLNQLTQASVSLGRIGELLAAEEREMRDESVVDGGQADGFELKDCTFRWNPLASDSFQLWGLDLAVMPGSITAVVGRTGSGKSSLLSALLGDMTLVQGVRRLDASAPIAYVPQQAYIFNASVRDNIIFGAAFDEPHYATVVEAACLGRDFSLLPAGDATEIGDKGVNLSGGQKQRVSIARALYHHREARLFLLDDPLSALDATVAKQVYEKAFLGLLAGKTRILVTNRIEFASSCDTVALFQDGTIAGHGPYAKLLKESEAFASLMKESGTVDEDESAGVEQVKAPEKGEAGGVDEGVAKRKGQEAGDAGRGKAKGDNQSKTTPHQDGQLIKKEYLATGAVSRKIFGVYAHAIGGLPTVVIHAALFLLVEAARSAAAAWLSVWSTMSAEISVIVAVSIYAGIHLVNLACGLGNQLLLARNGVRGGRSMHDDMYKSLLVAPMAFFDTTPAGRIVNRFTKDVADIDKNIIMSLAWFFRAMIQLFAALVIMGVTTYYALFAFAPLSAVFYWLQQYYNASAREIKRLDSVTRSPIYQQFGQSLDGLVSIRAYLKEEKVLLASTVAIDRHVKMNLASMSTNRWLGVRIESLGASLVLIVASFCVAAREVLGAGIAGLAITYSLQITGILSMCTRVWTMTEQAFNSVERVHEYAAGVDAEALATLADHRPASVWPEFGRIVYKDAWASYRSGLPPVLRGLSFEVEPQHKVGIVGRTGAGKSSTLLTLFRIVELSSGTISIDGVDISTVGLRDLRSRLGIIPQDPLIFMGSLRSNLDPFSEYAEDALWAALEQSHLAQLVRADPQGLEAPIEQGGMNLSVGQRQQLCLARAVLRDAKILVLDEATASVDVETDALIQQTIRNTFANCTMLTIAHRLQTIIDSDRVLVMDAGVVLEYDSPGALLSNTESAFYDMVAETGKAQAQMLIAAAISGAAPLGVASAPASAVGSQPAVIARRSRAGSAAFSQSLHLCCDIQGLLEKTDAAAEDLQAQADAVPSESLAKLLQLHQQIGATLKRIEVKHIQQLATVDH
eukprot:TRINITY_DN9414_c0_g1_i1.p1 TRINITY_DN9414_c0_g1~~TRINITY_DN9414_c0_g1_i1.p1  ORF type:complete len:1661 (-),score=279.42 TRINITY_DN9414_c0_g1_i1:84-4952(-)